MGNKAYLGIDTSNYTSSCAVYEPESDCFITRRQLLSVPDGQKGLRQSDVIFQHTKTLPNLIKSLLAENSSELCAVSASVSPRDGEDSYMPCFLVGSGYADAVSSSLKIPRYSFSHQAGHIAAALWSSGNVGYTLERFIAFHVSGGTTEAVLVSPDKESVFSVSEICSSLDLKAGQAVDRVGRSLGLGFPAGAELDSLSLESDAEYRIKPYSRDGCVSFSGLENRCADMLANGLKPCDIAKYCVEYILSAITEMTEYALGLYPGLPIVYAGGVMSNTIIAEKMQRRFFCSFAKPEFSSDNAAGTALLGCLKERLK